MQNVVAPRNQDVIYHYVMSCITLLKKQGIVTITRENEKTSDIIEQMVLHDQVRSRNVIVCQDYGHRETQLAKV